MKEIKAYVQRDRIADVIEALKECPAWGGERGDRRHSLAVCVVKSLLPLDSEQRHYSMDVGDEVLDEYKIELVCDDAEVDPLVDALVAAARTGRSVGGWVTVTDLARAVPIH